MIYDIGVIGAGPVGLFVPFMAGMKKLSCVVFEALDYVGGQCSALYPEKPIYDIPAFPNILARDLISNLQKQIEKFNPAINLSESIISYQKEGEIFILKTNKDRTFKVRSVVIASGGGMFSPNRPPLEGIEKFEGKSVFYSINNKNLFKDKNIAIAGGGDSAVDWAISLSEVAKKVYFIHRREKFKASPESIEIIQNIAKTGRIEFVLPFQLHSIAGESGFVKTLTLKNLTSQQKVLQIDALLPFFGLMTDSSLIENFALNQKEGLINTDRSTMQTNIKGIYAVGDIANYDGKLKLILAGFAEVASAVYDIKKFLYPEALERFEHSTSMFQS